MKPLFKCLLTLLLAALCAESATAQSARWRDVHTAKSKETLYGIAREYGLSVDELAEANPEMRRVDYKLKAGDLVYIPYPKAQAAATEALPQAKRTEKDVRQRAIRLGVMLPLHNRTADGRRMVEYYRGVLLACDSLKRLGISVNVSAWNVAEGDDMGKALADEAAARCDLIIGPLYSQQVKPLADFALQHEIKVLLPFAVSAPQVESNPFLFLAEATEGDYNAAVVDRFAARFPAHHVVLIDCNDSTSRKGAFTSALRKRLEAQGRGCSITSLRSGEESFTKAFSESEPNVVVLNSGGSRELNVAFAKLNNLSLNRPQLKITLFGYSEWMMHTNYNLDNFYKYNVHIPTTFFANPLAPRTARLAQKFRWYFHDDMAATQPRMAMAGFDHAFFFLKGLRTFGSRFAGAGGTVGYVAAQSPLAFERVGEQGGYENKTLLLVNYTPERRIETTNR